MRIKKYTLNKRQFRSISASVLIRSIGREAGMFGETSTDGEIIERYIKKKLNKIHGKENISAGIIAYNIQLYNVQDNLYM